MNSSLRQLCLVSLLPLATASCAGLDRVDQGTLQPQTVSGPCDATKFFLVNFTAMPTQLAVRNNGQACTLTLVNPDLQIFNTAALVTEQPSHGQATAGLLRGGVQAGLTYVPQPGFTGTDRFTVTLEPSDRAIRLNVTIAPG